MSTPTPVSTNRWIDPVIAAVLAVLAGGIFARFADLTVDPHHDGIMLKPALDVLSGQVLFKDSFTQYGPLTTYLQALALGLSPTLLSLRLLTVAAYAGSLFFLYLAWREFLPRFLCVVAAFWYVLYAPRDERKSRLDYLLGEKPVLILNQREPEMVSRFMAVIPDVGYSVVLHEPELRVWIALPVEEAEGLIK
jgi:hypothetical protein